MEASARPRISSGCTATPSAGRWSSTGFAATRFVASGLRRKAPKHRHLITNPALRQALVKGAAAHEMAEWRTFERQPSEERDNRVNDAVAESAELKVWREIHRRLMLEARRG